VSGVVVRVCAWTTDGRITTAAPVITVPSTVAKRDRRLVVPVLVDGERGCINCSLVSAASSAVVIEGSEKFFTDYCDALLRAC